MKADCCRWAALQLEQLQQWSAFGIQPAHRSARNLPSGSGSSWPSSAEAHQFNTSMVLAVPSQLTGLPGTCPAAPSTTAPWSAPPGNPAAAACERCPAGQRERELESRPSRPGWLRWSRCDTLVMQHERAAAALGRDSCRHVCSQKNLVSTGWLHLQESCSLETIGFGWLAWPICVCARVGVRPNLSKPMSNHS